MRWGRVGEIGEIALHLIRNSSTVAMMSGYQPRYSRGECRWCHMYGALFLFVYMDQGYTLYTYL